MMQRRGSEMSGVNQWLEECWRHGEVVADREGGLLRTKASHGAATAWRFDRGLHRLLRATRLDRGIRRG
jgi:hypothetical protein